MQFVRAPVAGDDVIHESQEVGARMARVRRPCETHAINISDLIH